MEHFLIVTNKQKDLDFKYTRRIQGFLEERGKTCYLQSGEEIGNVKVPDMAECIIVLGGDGTMLRAARAAAEAGIPIIGVNLGTMGYLAEMDCKHPEKALERLIADEYTKERRMMLSGRLLGAGEETGAGRSDTALNDIAITRSGPLQIISFHIYVNGKLLQTCQADGILVSTPTGSTGYNLSAGGPIVEPQAELILLTPICPHTLQSRTIVLSDKDTIVIEIGKNKRGIPQKTEACFDGGIRMELSAGDRMEIKKAEKTTVMLKLSESSFLEVLHQKMDTE